MSWNRLIIFFPSQLRSNRLKIIHVEFKSRKPHCEIAISHSIERKNCLNFFCTCSTESRLKIEKLVALLRYSIRCVFSFLLFLIICAVFFFFFQSTPKLFSHIPGVYKPRFIIHSTAGRVYRNGCCMFAGDSCTSNKARAKIPPGCSYVRGFFPAPTRFFILRKGILAHSTYEPTHGQQHNNASNFCEINCLRWLIVIIPRKYTSSTHFSA